MRIDKVHPIAGPTTGGNIVRFSGEGFDTRTVVLFGNAAAPKVLVDDTACYVHAPPQIAGPVLVSVCNAAGCAHVAQPYTYTKPALGTESPLTRLIRTLLQNLKSHFHDNTSMTVDVDASDPALRSDEGEGVSMLARLPALVLGGPDVRENRVMSRNTGSEAADTRGNIFVYGVPYTVDLTFTLTGASHSTVEMFNMLDAATTYLHQMKCVSMPRDPEFLELGNVSWPSQISEGARVHLDGIDGVRSFDIQFLVRGFDFVASHPTSVAIKTTDARVSVSQDLQ